ncbi:MAG: hypothetical protein EAZ25_25575 [Oscillatoriales cyanobacterium]|nr:MAG: hypothetical protein EAZ88_16800 [Oscillatoriales cyanobacterium]TAG63074.1 MAG: hypothetical protein EAZ25_25575 [Oscillatoriales cyanobacterium]
MNRSLAKVFLSKISDGLEAHPTFFLLWDGLLARPNYESIVYSFAWAIEIACTKTKSAQAE